MDLKTGIKNAIQENLPKMVADELLERITEIEELEEANKELEGRIKELKLEKAALQEVVGGIEAREETLKGKEEALAKRDEEVKSRELLDLKLAEAEKREHARMECFGLVFKNRQWRENVSRSHYEQYNSNQGTYETLPAGENKEVTEE